MCCRLQIISQAAEIGIVGFRIVRRLGGDDLLFPAGELRRNWSAMLSATSLSTEKMSVSLRSKVSAQRCESLAALISCTFTRTASPLFCTLPSRMWATPSCLRDLRQVSRRAFVVLSRSARDHFQIGDLRQARQDFVLDAVGKVGVGFVLAQVFEGKTAMLFSGSPSPIASDLGKTKRCRWRSRRAPQRNGDLPPSAHRAAAS